LYLDYNQHHGAVVEAPDQNGMVPTSFSNISKNFEIIHMLWMGSGYIIAPLLPHLLAPILGVDRNFGSSHLGYNQHHGAVVEAPDPHGMVPTSFFSKISKVFEIVSMLWKGK
jgi:hypothetical protein